MMNHPSRLLNNLTPDQFLAEYWQKKPLIIRQAMPNFVGLLNANELAGLACEEDVQSRIVRLDQQQWSVQDGPFDEDAFANLPEQNWTLLVQSVNHHLDSAAHLLTQFNFIPHTRLDDLMVSYAPNGGGVGPHFDSYDVFLLQGSGKRRWQISSQQNYHVDPNAPIKIITDFIAEQEWVLESGDMLYLPPQYAHYGVAVGDDCMTYSIGFRAPTAQELGTEFLSYLQDHLNINGLYQDPDLSLQTHPAAISPSMVDKVATMIDDIQWHHGSIADFLGCYLSEPKPHIVFEANDEITPTQFAQTLAKQGIALARQSQLLFWQTQFYLNGERLSIETNLVACMQILADKRCIQASELKSEHIHPLAQLLLPHYLAGYLVFK